MAGTGCRAVAPLVVGPYPTRPAEDAKAGTRHSRTVTPAELRARAVEEVAELGPEPADPHDRALWAEERRGACVLLAAFAEWDASLCRRAELEPAEWADPVVRGLLLDAAQECSQTRVGGRPEGRPLNGRYA